MARVHLLLAHPLPESFCAAIADRAETALAAGGHEVDRLDLYQEGFDPRLTAAERHSYYHPPADLSAVASYVDRLQAADKVVLVFPQWWFNVPAILKGWFDRVFQPGVAFDHTPGYGQIEPRLDKLDSVLAVTTLGSPWWVAELVMRNPVRRQIKSGIVWACARQARFRMLNCYGTEKLSAAQREAFLGRVERAARSL
ncbi:NAD(P)H-dependent oxidoreductase [Pelagibius marinus]|uniref:NAD(P)H-dependent oxidoreductase n=1 Tax=Pelagibius marinus TaxID=2762760 RepID=UPI00187336F7|nr:NAD(P)H-dependent oxidoreductase [Pelagibius marinus]